eukprot:Gregarina_sp_Poly_1__1160@NODE_1284_length_4497_cov_74_202257_g6_i1_p6_GENE_NODE_1284_length_4497_cov_74_202257_g6_i1NODE_1284_length_4497_cov_74_202257_g6_i1_p6_ORF_typecomplete_len102_score17_62_NODE_1284_length_4497_cov_74_202257_g6_i132233528
MNYRRIFAIFALPYLLYLESLKPPGMGSGRDDDVISEDDDDELDDPQSEVTTMIARSVSGDFEVDGSDGSKSADEQWIYKGAREVNPRRATQIFNQMPTIR